VISTKQHEKSEKSEKSEKRIQQMEENDGLNFYAFLPFPYY
jgi:hypothetical protein